MATRKRKRKEDFASARKKEVHQRQPRSDEAMVVESSDDDCDLLKFMDEGRKREVAELRSRRDQAKQHGNPLDDDEGGLGSDLEGDKCAEGLTQLQMGVGSEGLDEFVCMAKELRRWKPSPDEAMMMESSDDDCDLLKVLDEERKRELTKLRVRRWRAKQKPRLVKDDGDFDNELDDDERAECLGRLQMALGPGGLDESVCVACDRVAFCHDSRRVDDTDLLYFRALKSALDVKWPDLPTALVEQYQAPSNIATLRDVLISPRGIHEYVDGNGFQRSWISVCKECDRSISQGNLPQFAVANGFFVGRLPEELTKLAIPERFMTQLTSISAITRVMRGGRHRCIRSYCMAFDCTPGPPITLLPRSLESVASYRVVMVGEFTAAQEVEVRKLHRIRNKLVRDVLGFYTANNHLYKETEENVSVDSSDYPDARVDEALIERVADPERRLEDGINSEQETVCGESDAWRVAYEQDECRVIERRIGLRDEETPVMVREHPVTSNADSKRERSFEIRKSDHVASDVSGDLFGRMFPHFFLSEEDIPGNTGRPLYPFKSA